MIKALIFDWGGVCCQEGEPFASAALQAAVGLTPSEIAIKVQDLYSAYYRGELASEDFWHQIMGRFGLAETPTINPAALSAAYLGSYLIYSEILDLIGCLRHNYLIGLLSNLTPEMRDHIRKEHQIQNYFDAEVYSCDTEVAALKPDTRPFAAILKKLNLLPAECLFIDDSEKNIVAATVFGFHVLHFKSPADFLSLIKKYVKV